MRRVIWFWVLNIAGLVLFGLWFGPRWFYGFQFMGIGYLHWFFMTLYGDGPIDVSWESWANLGYAALWGGFNIRYWVTGNEQNAVRVSG